jgi:hypothetical protein
MHYIMLKAEKKELKKLRQANESNRPEKIQTSSPVSDVACSVAKCCRSVITQSDTRYESSSLKVLTIYFDLIALVNKK